MSINLNPYISFVKNTREAMTFYHSVFGGELSLSTFGDMHASENPETIDLIMHSVLTVNSGFTLMASDTSDRSQNDKGAEISVSVGGNAGDEQSLRASWDALSMGAEITAPLETAMWGDTFGMLTDRFGIHWLFNIRAAES